MRGKLAWVGLAVVGLGLVYGASISDELAHGAPALAQLERLRALRPRCHERERQRVRSTTAKPREHLANGLVEPVLFSGSRISTLDSELIEA